MTEEDDYLQLLHASVWKEQLGYVGICSNQHTIYNIKWCIGLQNVMNKSVRRWKVSWVYIQIASIRDQGLEFFEVQRLRYTEVYETEVPIN